MRKMSTYYEINGVVLCTAYSNFSERELVHPQLLECMHANAEILVSIISMREID